MNYPHMFARIDCNDLPVIGKSPRFQLNDNKLLRLDNSFQKGYDILMNNIIGIIPARGGSKGIPRKNIKKLAGKPLLSYLLKQLIGVSY